MKGPAAPLRFLILVIGGWTLGRAALLLPGVGGVIDQSVIAPKKVANALRAREARHGPADQPSAVAVALSGARHVVGHRSAHGAVRTFVDPDAPHPDSAAAVEWRLASHQIIPVPPPPTPSPVAHPASASRRAPRWSGSIWLFARPEDGRSGLAAAGQLGGSQAGARMAYRLTDPETGSLALAARLSSPLRDRDGAEAALGLDWRPVAEVPFRLSAERRIAIGPDGRDAWSLYAAGGFWRGGLPAELEMDGYGQAGVVGARSRDLFADGALRIGRAIPLANGKRLVLGGGAWGAAQPGVSRIDIGPRVALSLPLAGTTVTGAVDWRIRVAGHASPDSGAAFTIATDF